MSRVDDRSLSKPTLNLVVAEDNAWWSEKLQGLAEDLRHWSFAKTGQFELSVHACRSVEGFESLVSSLLSDGALVYTTLDLKMPLGEGEQTADPDAGEKLIKLCLHWKRQGERLEFCLVSEFESILDRLYRDSSDLRKLGIRKISKNQILETDGQKNLLDVVVDIQRFVRRNLSFCTIELPPGSGEKVPIWFGGEEPLLSLLNRADQIANADAGVYIIFADAGGYEADWVKLCCELRGVRLTYLDIAAVNPMFSSEWKAHFQDPPEALLVCHLDRANDQGCDIAPLLEKEKFFEKVAKRKSLVFFQFPILESNLDVSKLDDTIEIPILEACLHHIHQDHPSRLRQQSLSFAFEDHRRIVNFPPYDILRNVGVVRKTIELQVLESQRKTGCDGASIDPELFELLIEIPWDQKGGLHDLRRSIKSAYESFAANKNSADLVKEEHFRNSAVIVDESTSELGFLVRGHRLYRILETRDTALTSSRNIQSGSAPEEALRSLEVLWQLYDGLERLRQLRDHVGRQPSNQSFTPQHYDTLHEARSFLDSLFDSPLRLREMIDDFRPHLKRRAWKSYYPALDDSRIAAVENIRFSWPFSRLPLHPSVYGYLQENGVSALIQKEIQESLQRYPDLKIQWEEANNARLTFSKEMTRREEERKRAEKFAREGHSQPVLVHLLPRTNKEDPRSSFQAILSSFLMFNSYLALAENNYTFGLELFTDKEDMRNVLKKVELGHMVGFLCRYTKKLRASDHISKSLFSRWTNDWTETGGQRDAIRLISQLAGELLNSGNRKNGLSKEERTAIESAAGAVDGEARLGTGAILNLLLQLRNGHKYFPDTFERDYGPRLRDFMRRFVAATTGEYRLGKVTGEQTIELWRKEPGEQSEPADLMGPAATRWPGHFVVASEALAENNESTAYKVLFPVDDLIRLRPGHDSIWAYNKKSWLNLTHVGDSDDDLTLSAGAENWLPQQQDEELTSSELWSVIFND